MTLSLHRIDEPPAPPVDRFALWALGFRPFYLLGAAFAALSVPLWTLQVTGRLGTPYLAGPVWHAHEMLFGFALAVIVGFLFTAGRNWSGRPTPTGAPLAALVLLWLAARVLVLTPWGAAAAAVNVLFPLAAAVALAVPLVRGRNWRNLFFVGLLVLFGVAALGVHLAHLGVTAPLVPAAVSSAVPGRALALALDMVLFIVAVMGGRVIPMFTNNGVPGAGARRFPGVERAALGLLLVVAAADVTGVHGLPLGGLAAAGAVAHGLRWAGWRPWTTRRAPLVWVLHAAYAWVPVHLALRALAEAGLVAPSAATHALTAGAIGGMVIGMITRTARGHTGRPLRADRVDTACYALVLAGALLRVAGPLLAPDATVALLQASALAWSGGFGLYAWRYWPVLTRSRVDGRPG